MREFKFFEKPKPIGNHYLSFDMDTVLIHVLIYKQLNNISIMGIDMPFHLVNVPINGFLRINGWRTYDNILPDMVEIDYSVIELNTTPTHFRFRMQGNEFMARIQNNQYDTI
jgi:hypothetical protein